MEMLSGTNYCKLGIILNGLSLDQSVTRGHPGKAVVKMLAQSDGERTCLKYAIFKASCMTPTAAW